MKIKPVSISDLEVISKLEKKVFKENAFSKDLIKELISNNLLFLKLEKGRILRKIIGIIVIIRDRRDRLNIANFLIHPHYQNNKYGTYLLEYTLKKIKSMNNINIKKIILNVKIDNSKAIHLYQKFQFKNVKKINNYYQNGESAYLMELNILGCGD